MKKWRLFAGILAVLLVISLWMNVQHNAEKEAARRRMFNELFFYMNEAAYDLDRLLVNLELNAPDDATIRLMLSAIADGFLRVDMTLAQYQTYFRGEQLNYNSTFGFEFITQSLGSGWGEYNQRAYSCVLRDDVISEKDVQYLTALRDDMLAMVLQMQNPETGLGEDPKLTIDRLNRILSDFFDVWSFHNEGSPYHLLLD